jgi:hypothetical protein
MIAEVSPTLEALSGAVVDWLTREERALTRVMDRGSDTVVAERLEIWKQHLKGLRASRERHGSAPGGG